MLEHSIGESSVVSEAPQIGVEIRKSEEFRGASTVHFKKSAIYSRDEIYFHT